MQEQILALLGIAEVVKSAVVDATKVAEVNAAVKKALVTSVMSDGQKLLVAKSENMDPQTLKKWAEGNIEFFDAVKYVRKDVTKGSGIIEIFTDSLDRDPGVANISKGRLDSNENLMLSRIEMQWDRMTGGTVKTGAYAPIGVSTDVAILNGEIELTVGGKTIVKIPVASINQPPIGVQGVAANCNGFNLKAPKLIREGEDIQIRLHTAGTIASSTDVDLVEFKLMGDCTKAR